jgi:GH24 family phage-related lysozyme (muramidase)
MADTRADEHRLYIAEPDLGGVWTICDGHTKGIHKGDTADDAECDADTAADLLAAGHEVLRCAPALKGHHQQLRAAIRFQNNTGHFCASSAAPLFRAGKLKAGCDKLLAYIGIVTAQPMHGRSVVSVRKMRNGKYYNVIRGLINRRNNEHKVCVSDL